MDVQAGWRCQVCCTCGPSSLRSHREPCLAGGKATRKLLLDHCIALFAPAAERANSGALLLRGLPRCASNSGVGVPQDLASTPAFCAHGEPAGGAAAIVGRATTVVVRSARRVRVTTMKERTRYIRRSSTYNVCGRYRTFHCCCWRRHQHTFSATLSLSFR